MAEPRRRLGPVWGVLLALLLAAVTMAGDPSTGRDAAALLARPTENGAEDAFTVPPQQQYAADTTHFRIHYTDTGVDAATPSFVKRVGVMLERSWTVQVEQLGWPRPLWDEGRGGTGRDGRQLIDAYLVDLGDGPYGYAAADDDACRGCRSVPGFLVLENDYAGYEPDPDSALRSTAAHEFAHLIHLGMAVEAEGWAFESTAVWMERVVFPEADARSAYLADFAGGPAMSLTDFSERTGGFDRAYGAYVWPLFLADRYGPDVVLRAWELAAAADGHVMGGFAAALAERGSSLDEAFVAFAAATAAWEVGGFPAEPVPYPTVARERTLASGRVMEVEVDHVAAHVVDVEVGDEVSVTVRGPRHVAGGVALVATGAGRVLSAVDATLFDGEAQVTLSGVGSAGRVTVVVVNADATLAEPKGPGDVEPRYLRDDVALRFGVDVDPGPPAKR